MRVIKPNISREMVKTIQEKYFERLG